MSKLKLKAQFFTKTKKQRLYELDIAIIGLTGSIATGKSSAAKTLKSLGHPVIDADQLVKQIYLKDESIELISSINSKMIIDNKIDFVALREAFFADKTIKEKIQNYIFNQLEDQFLLNLQNITTANYVIYDIPLLFEKKLSQNFDLTVCVHTSPDIQLKRLMHRDNISKQLALEMINSQIPITKKATMADIEIDNNGSESMMRDALTNFTKSKFTLSS